VSYPGPLPEGVDSGWTVGSRVDPDNGDPIWFAAVLHWPCEDDPPRPGAAPEHWTWELVGPDGCVALDGCVEEDPSPLLRRIVAMQNETGDVSRKLYGDAVERHHEMIEEITAVIGGGGTTLDVMRLLERWLDAVDALGADPEADARLYAAIEVATAAGGNSG
jgi:hypothetical protein